MADCPTCFPKEASKKTEPFTCFNHPNRYAIHRDPLSVTFTSLSYLTPSPSKGRQTHPHLLATQQAPISIFFAGPVGEMSKSKISIGSPSVMQAFGISTRPPTCP